MNTRVLCAVCTSVFEFRGREQPPKKRGKKTPHFPYHDSASDPLPVFKGVRCTKVVSDFMCKRTPDAIWCVHRNAVASGGGAECTKGRQTRRPLVAAAGWRRPAVVKQVPESFL